jgi:hypothetical protein
MSVFKKRKKKDSDKPRELRELAGSQTEEVGVSALGLKGRKTGDGDGSAGN